VFNRLNVTPWKLPDSSQNDIRSELRGVLQAIAVPDPGSVRLQVHGLVESGPASILVGKIQRASRLSRVILFSLAPEREFTLTYN